MIFQSPNNPNSHLTVKERENVSFPTRILWERNQLTGDILDFGCGLGKDISFLQEKGFNVDGYDPYYSPQYPKKQYDTILCNYVLNVLLPEEQAHVFMAVSELLKKGGKAYFAVRRDIQKSGFIYNPKRDAKVYQANVILPYPSFLLTTHCEIYEYQQFAHEKEGTFITETTTVFAVLVEKGKAYIFPKRVCADYFALSEHEQRACNIVLNRVKRLFDGWYSGGDYEVKIQVNPQITHTCLAISTITN